MYSRTKQDVASYDRRINNMYMSAKMKFSRANMLTYGNIIKGLTLMIISLLSQSH